MSRRDHSRGTMRGNRGAPSSAPVALYSITNGATFNADADKIVVADHANLSPTAAFTIGGWIRPGVVAGTEQEVCNKYVSGSNGWIARIDNLRLRFFVGDDASIPSGVTGNVLTINVAYHVAFVFNGAGAADADRLKIYLDGSDLALTISAAVPTATTDSAADLIFGGGLGELYTGTMAQWAFWNRALTAAEVLADYGRIRPSSGLVAHWPLQSDSVDIVGGHNGTDTSITYGAF